MSLFIEGNWLQGSMYVYFQDALIIEVRLFMDVYSSSERSVLNT